MRAPSIILPGPGKAGTTSLFWYLAQHADICRSAIKETLYFTPASQTEADGDGRLAPIADYRGYFDRWMGERYLLEATPRYFAGGPQLVSALTGTLPDARVIVTLRDPVARTWSLYRFAQSKLFIPKSQTFEEYLEVCASLRRSGELQTGANRAHWNATISRYADFLPAWLEGVSRERLKIVFFEDMVADTTRTLTGLCEWLGLATDAVGRWDLEPHNQTTPIRMQLLQRAAHAANHERLLRNRPRIRRPFRAVYFAVNRDRSRSQMRWETRKRLEEEYAEPNRRLYRQLARAGYRELPGWLTP